MDEPERSLAELLATDDPAWPVIQEWLAAANQTVETLAPDRERAARILLSFQITARSPLAAIAWETGGLLFDQGWLRCLGSDSERLRGDLLAWNGWDPASPVTPLSRAVVVAHDALGGFFAINGGAFSGEFGQVFYGPPDSLAWANTELTYSELLQWAATGDLTRSYENLRWPGWETEVEELGGDLGFSIDPPLYASEGGPLSERSRQPMPLPELRGMKLAIVRQLSGRGDPSRLSRFALRRSVGRQRDSARQPAASRRVRPGGERFRPGQRCAPDRRAAAPSPPPVPQNRPRAPVRRSRPRGPSL